MSVPRRVGPLFALTAVAATGIVLQFCSDDSSNPLRESKPVGNVSSSLTRASGPDTPGTRSNARSGPNGSSTTPSRRLHLTNLPWRRRSEASLPSADALVVESLACIQSGKFSEARSLLERLLALYPDSKLVPTATYRIGKANLQEGNILQADVQLRDFLAQYPDHELADRAWLDLSHTMELVMDWLRQHPQDREAYGSTLDDWVQEMLWEYQDGANQEGAFPVLKEDQMSDQP